MREFRRRSVPGGQIRDGVAQEVEPLSHKIGTEGAWAGRVARVRRVFSRNGWAEKRTPTDSRAVEPDAIVPRQEIVGEQSILAQRAAPQSRRPQTTETTSLHDRGDVQTRRLHITFLNDDTTVRTLIDAGYTKNGEPARGFYVDPDVPHKVFRYAFMSGKVTEESRASAQSSVDRYVRDYSRLQSCGINFPGFEPSLGEDLEEGYLLLLSEVDVVRGQDLRDYLRTHELTPEVQGKIEDTFKHKIGYINDTITGGHRYLSDPLVLEQYMIGNTAKDPEEKIYMVDVAPEGREMSGEVVYKMGMRQVVLSLQIAEALSGKIFGSTRKLLLSEIENMYALLRERIGDSDEEKSEFLESTHKQILREFNEEPLF